MASHNERNLEVCIRVLVIINKLLSNMLKMIKFDKSIYASIIVCNKTECFKNIYLLYYVVIAVVYIVINVCLLLRGYQCVYNDKRKLFDIYFLFHNINKYSVNKICKKY